jgi:hypothetical protein
MCINHISMHEIFGDSQVMQGVMISVRWLMPINLRLN